MFVRKRPSVNMLGGMLYFDSLEEKGRKFKKNANSGCLGLTHRRRTHIAAKCVGEELRSYDPAVSEWGNLARVMPSCSRAK